ncbi:hypothetical protein MLD38_016257 [Melastoma candidum]|uniref:Uncharacterized protein n=1 Tax=Melastoma candidum TaxID=119954 RepID=A0ACB9RLY2_9MYRT|nr:hypothetical protein MLD38_016257 [Melastoma candidum]
MVSEDSSSKRAVVIGKLADAVMRCIPKRVAGAKSPLLARKSIEQRLVMMFPDFPIPDHPPYSLMIEQAIAQLNEEGGSSEESISKCITVEYNSLPWAHASFLHHHLKKLCDQGEIIYTRDKRYMLRSDRTADIVSPAASMEKVERGHERKQEFHVQNKISKRERSLESQNTKYVQKYQRRRTETKVNNEKSRSLNGGQTMQLESLIHLRDSDLAVKGSIPINLTGEDSWARCAQHLGKDEVAEDTVCGIGEQREEEQVDVSDKHCTGEEHLAVEQDFCIINNAEPGEQHDRHPDVLMVQQDQVETVPTSAQDTGKPIGPRNGRPPEVICQHILKQQKELEELVEHLKQNMEMNRDDILPRDKCIEFLRRNRLMELALLEMLKPYSESSNSISNHGLGEDEAGASVEATG